MARSKPRNPPLRVLVTAGPTREHVDPVRFLSNESSGRMGFALADAAARAGHAVTLVAGPVELPTPVGVERIDVESAREMLAACRKAFRRADLLVMAAAVADWRPARALSGKWRAKDGGARRATLALVRNPDILATLAARKGRRIVCGFALETGAGERRARAKLVRKGLDVIVLNDASVLRSHSTRVQLLGRDGRHVEFAGPKTRVARDLVRALRTPGPELGSPFRAGSRRVSTPGRSTIGTGGALESPSRIGIPARWAARGQSRGRERRRGSPVQPTTFDGTQATRI